MEPAMQVALLGPGYTCTDDTGQLLLANVEQHADRKCQNANHDQCEASKQPEGRANVLPRARRSSPVRKAACIIHCAQAMADVAYLATIRSIRLSILVHTVTMSRTLAGSRLAAVL